MFHWIYKQKGASKETYSAPFKAHLKNKRLLVAERSKMQRNHRDSFIKNHIVANMTITRFLTFSFLTRSIQISIRLISIISTLK